MFGKSTILTCIGFVESLLVAIAREIWEWSQLDLCFEWPHMCRRRNDRCLSFFERLILLWWVISNLFGIAARCDFNSRSDLIFCCCINKTDRQTGNDRASFPPFMIPCRDTMLKSVWVSLRDRLLNCRTGHARPVMKTRCCRQKDRFALTDVIDRQFCVEG